MSSDHGGMLILIWSLTQNLFNQFGVSQMDFVFCFFDDQMVFGAVISACMSMDTLLWLRPLAWLVM